MYPALRKSTIQDLELCWIVYYSQNVTLNWDKCRFKATSVNFLGHVIDSQGIHPDPAKTTAIAEMKPPTNITELRRFLGMANQMGKFSSSLADFSLPLRELLSPKNAMSSTERNYAQIEKEALATTWACEKFHDYILGTKFQIESDHKPLIM